MESLNMENIGKSIRNYRTYAELTQDQLAKEVGVSSSAIGMYEQGRRTPPVDVLYDISIALSVDFADLVPEVRTQSSDSELNLIIKRLKEELDRKPVRVNSRVETIAAHLDSDELTDNDLDDIEQFVKFVKNKKK